jgi:hypothetical protein
MYDSKLSVDGLKKRNDFGFMKTKELKFRKIMTAHNYMRTKYCILLAYAHTQKRRGHF